VAIVSVIYYLALHGLFDVSGIVSLSLLLLFSSFLDIVALRGSHYQIRYPAFYIPSTHQSP